MKNATPGNLELKRSHVMLDTEKLEFISCTEIGLYLCYRKRQLTYGLIQPAISFLMWANLQKNVRIDQLDLSMLEDKGMTFVTYSTLDEEPDLSDIIDQLEERAMVGEHDTKDRIIIMPYADEKPGEQNFYLPVVMRIKMDEEAL